MTQIATVLDKLRSALKPSQGKESMLLREIVNQGIALEIGEEKNAKIHTLTERASGYLLVELIEAVSAQGIREA